jgi:hypothetical protein
MTTNDLLTFAGNHPVLAFFLALLFVGAVCNIIMMPYRLINRIMRHRNIHKHGYPPAHCDADGDFRKEEE